MYKTFKLLVVFGLLVLTAWGTLTVANAMGEHDGSGGDGGRRGGRLSGVVTAVTDSAITITRTHHLAQGDVVTRPHRLEDRHPITSGVGVTALINVNTATVVHLIECQCAGTLADVTVGAQIHVKGQRQDNGSTTALTITISPEGNKVGGSVTVISDALLTVRNRHSVTNTISTTAETKFFTKEGAATLANIAVGSKVMAFGAKQADGSLIARVVLIRDAAPSSTGVVDGAAVDELVDVFIADDTTTTNAATLVNRLFLPVVRLSQ
jgi:hypothetical protein